MKKPAEALFFVILACGVIASSNAFAGAEATPEEGILFNGNLGNGPKNCPVSDSRKNFGIAGSDSAGDPYETDTCSTNGIASPGSGTR